MEGYLVDDLEDCERLYMAAKDKHIKDFYRFQFRQILEKIVGSLMVFSSAMENTGRIMRNGGHV